MHVLGELSFRELEIVLLTRENYERYIKEIHDFNGGDNFAISEYIRDEAYFNHITYKESTALVFRRGDLVGYFSLRVGSIDFPQESFPVLEVVRLATDEEHQREGIGTTILDYISNVATMSCIRYITLEALSEKKIWYMNRGFISLSEEEIETDFSYCYMCKDMYRDVLVEEYMEKRGNII